MTDMTPNWMSGEQWSNCLWNPKSLLDVIRVLYPGMEVFYRKQPTLQDTQDYLTEGITQNGLELYLKSERPKRMDYTSDCQSKLSWVPAFLEATPSGI